MDPGRTPERILFAHPSDEIAQLTIDLWPPCPISGFPAPKRFETGAMPSQDSFRLHDPGHVEQTGPNPRHPYQQRPITAVQPQPMSTTKIHSTCRIANIGPDDAMILAHAANPDGSNFRK
jgi:hypothetical protein